MPGRANLRRATNHWAVVRSGYCPIGLLFCRVTASWAFIPRANRKEKTKINTVYVKQI